MNELRLRPKSDYLHTADWKDLYVLTTHWKSDMNYFRDELRFLDNLFGKYFIWMTKKKNIAKVESLAAAVRKLEKERKTLAAAIKKHLTGIGLLMENAFSQDEQQFRDEHSRLEEDIATFTKNFRKVKKAVFTTTGQVMESENLHRLLTA